MQGNDAVDAATGQHDDLQRHKRPPFTDAPFVHPFRHPSYHAQQLRAISFAQAHGRRLMWITAHDVPKTVEKKRGAEQHEVRKERWMEFHDRYTAGTGNPGHFPCTSNAMGIIDKTGRPRCKDAKKPSSRRSRRLGECLIR